VQHRLVHEATPGLVGQTKDDAAARAARHSSIEKQPDSPRAAFVATQA
jgi:hypothetical protein